MALDAQRELEQEARHEIALPKLTSPPEKGQTLGARLRNYFLTGIIVAGPVAVTAYIVWWIITTVDGWVEPLVPQAYLPDLPFRIPGYGLLFAIIGLTLLGFLTANLVGRSLLRLGEVVLGRMPLVRGVYRTFKQIFETIFSQSGTSFRKVGLVQYPAKGMWSIVFISSEPGTEIAARLPGEQHISVFLPCTPNPTTGFYFYLPRSEVIELPIPVEDGAKLIMSAGLIQPGDPRLKLAPANAGELDKLSAKNAA
ncbi:MAG: DUF502 domain-containing protein [Hyphomicrobiales bacterium]|nr:DUF502 domain-containing protein [Hyphomicrobiales bacterium]